MQQIALHLSAQCQRSFGPLLLECLRHILQEGQDVLLAQFGIHSELQAARRNGIHKRHWESHVDGDATIGGLQFQPGNLDAVVGDGHFRNMQFKGVETHIPVAQRTVRPTDAAHAVSRCSQVSHQFLHDDFSHAGLHQRSVIHPEGQHRLADSQFVGMYLPVVLLLGSILRYGIIEHDVQHSFLQRGTVQLHRLLVQVYSLAAHEESSNASLHVCCLYEITRIYLYPIDFQLIDNHTFIHQWLKLYINYKTTYISNGILLDDLNLIDFQIEGERQADIPYGDVHARLFRGNSCHLIYSPVLHGRTIEQ